jgi:hypothetical protein
VGWRLLLGPIIWHTLLRLIRTVAISTYTRCRIVIIFGIDPVFLLAALVIEGL